MVILKEYVSLTGEIVCRTGLRIGGSGGQLEIGAVDNTLLRDPVSGLLYMPGSSLKGKMRSGLEALKQNFNSRRQPQDTDPCGCGECSVCRLFGPYQNTTSNAGPTRLLVRDLHLTEKAREELRAYEREGRSGIEEKTENLINRRTRAATNPRTSERIAPGLAFELQLVLRIFDDDDRAALIGEVERALGQVVADGLGSSVSRGYGQIEVRNLQRSVRNASNERVPSSD
jgi:CRISPR-associated protein Csm3